ncbi:aminotransferase class V-fold PLP-dependent enzyme [Gramella sp. AN32]|uniref:Aminotransferase class V-fold PLP-dependent enzyme n=1 Tax=Christiangramia antarctica TaxID=2058158 RepID=A0ABW5X2X6_9FLAO|nr:aminotransferase class V-fold PLP-dependent enzyme [Gramella sp. AN32]MCM4157735.1 aminotransferase [Gramella sp. AN32]
MDNLRKGFPVLEQYIYLNTAASGLLPEKVWEFRQGHDMDFLIQGSILKEKQGELLAKVREAVGRFFHCEPNRVALVPNFSYGFNSFLESVPADSKFLLLKDEYPSINWPVNSRNFETVFAEINETLEANIIEKLQAEKPDYFCFSIVNYIHGIKLGFDFLKKLKADFPEVSLIADGTQFCGTEDFNFDESRIDVLISSAYKWMNAGYGNGFMLFNHEIQKKISPKHLGFGSLQGKYKTHEGNFIGKFEPGHQDTLNYGSLKIAIELIEKIGISSIQQQIGHLKNLARKRFMKAEIIEKWMGEREDFSSIFNIKGDEKLFKKLRENDIIVSQRGNGLRVSMHYFNSEKDLNRLFSVLGI